MKRAIKSGVYGIWLDGEIVYIGSSVNIYARWNHHRWDLRHGSHHSRYLQNTWNLRNEDEFIFTIIEDCVDSTELWIREQHHIDMYHPKFNMCKIMTPEGQSRIGLKHTPETIEKMRAYQSTRTPWNAETRAKISKSLLGNKRQSGGTGVISIEQREKLRIANVGQKRSDVDKKNIRDGNARSWADPIKAEARRKRLKETMLRKWADPEYRQMILAARADRLLNPKSCSVNITKAHPLPAQ